MVYYQWNPLNLFLKNTIRTARKSRKKKEFLLQIIQWHLKHFAASNKWKKWKKKKIKKKMILKRREKKKTEHETENRKLLPNKMKNCLKNAFFLFLSFKSPANVHSTILCICICIHLSNAKSDTDSFIIFRFCFCFCLIFVMHQSIKKQKKKKKNMLSFSIMLKQFQACNVPLFFCCSYCICS